MRINVISYKIILLNSMFILVIGCSTLDKGELPSHRPQKFIENTSNEITENTITFIKKPMNNDYINKFILRGSHFSYGFQWGVMSKKANVKPLIITKNKILLNNEIRKMYENIYPPYLEIIKGIASAFEIKEDDIDLRDMEWRFFVHSGWDILGYAQRANNQVPRLNAGCSAIAVKENETGEVFIGRNFDWDQHNGSIIDTKLNSDYRVQGMSIISPESWIIDGMNEHGLFIGVMTVVNPQSEFIKNAPYPDYPAIDTHHLMKIILNSCKTVNEAINLTKLVKTYFGSESIHFLLADSSGEMVIFEFDSEGDLILIQDDKNYMLIANTRLHDSNMDERFLDFRYAIGQYYLDNRKPTTLEETYELIKRMSPGDHNPLMKSKYSKNIDDSFWDWGIWTSLYELRSKKSYVKMIRRNEIHNFDW